MASNILVLLVALLHLYFLILEMFLWDKPKGMKTFGTTQEYANASKALAANQGLYNGFLSAGLIWGLLAKNNSHDIKIFFLSCVIVAGLYGAKTVNKRIFFVQALPAIIAILLLLLKL
ncbi:MAG: DUF1304 domain-containing protein [Caulobacterales bacterium]|nr:DUF1304 domain-containing protein [Caulobacterales bacterium]MCA0373034.1 DUF1304 domain-containing protein [Pseudomonadota bacterium]